MNAKDKWTDIDINPDDIYEYERAGITPEQVAPYVRYDSREAEDVIGFIRCDVDPHHADKWEEAGIKGRDVWQWHVAGFGADDPYPHHVESVIYRGDGRTPDEILIGVAGEFVAMGMGPEEAWEWWIGAEMWPDEARAWIAAGFDPREAYDFDYEGIGPAGAAEWRDAGFTPEEAVMWWTGAEMWLDEAQAWKAAGFEPEEAYEYKYEGIGPEEAKAWRTAGLTPAEAAKARDAGLTPEEAAVYKKEEER